MTNNRVKKWMLFILPLICLLLGSFIALVNMKRDRTPPVITYETEVLMPTEAQIKRLQQEDFDLLLKGVYAEDDRDGDLTDKLFIHNIEVMYGDLYAVVTYRVMDSAQNLATGYRLVYFKSPAEIHELLLRALSGEHVEEFDSGTTVEPEEPEEPEEPVEAEPVPESEPSFQHFPILAVQKEVTISAGASFNPLNYVLGMADDKDSYRTLVNNAILEGEYDVNTPGTYTLIFYTTDSDGNRSDNSVMVLKVE